MKRRYAMLVVLMAFVTGTLVGTIGWHSYLTVSGGELNGPSLEQSLEVETTVSFVTRSWARSNVRGCEATLREGEWRCAGIDGDESGNTWSTVYRVVATGRNCWRATPIRAEDMPRVESSETVRGCVDWYQSTR